jgi:predicted NAD/FAD-binding protein
LAATTGSNEDALHRAAEGAGSVGIFKENRRELFTHPVSEALCADAQNSMRDKRAVSPTRFTLSYTTRSFHHTGETVPEKIYGLS